MSAHRAGIAWSSTATAAEFTKGRYSREHSWTFDDGITVAASRSSSVVPAPWSNPAHVDPEEAYVASVSSCHMLTFLYLGAQAGFAVASYVDDAIGAMTKTTQGVMWTPRIEFADRRPSAEELDHLHHEAHAGCFIANSVKTEIAIG